ncbi:hypothetical protein PRZ48_013150 [Zasmidium cellare]|uniref:Uncharacterized protein n=1 Tax=Zasmidium cellare TaxID=395010 RepID=A0ABR0E392_ZASCE|nr:hypothetical protein PRZ48_013150 [Zasmidium cellare]
MTFWSGLHALLTNESPYSPLLNAVLICFFAALALVMAYMIQSEINTQVSHFRLVALPFSLRLAFARTRLQNAKHRLNAAYGRVCPNEWADRQCLVQQRRDLLFQVEREADQPMRAWEQAEWYQVLWWTGMVSMPELKEYVEYEIAESGWEGEGYWFSEDEENDADEDEEEEEE